MKFIPILYSTPMVLANLARTKTQTRRVLSHQPQEGYLPEIITDHFGQKFLTFRKSRVLVEEKILKFKYGQPGDIHWVKETIYQNGELGLEYVADREDIDEEIIPLDFNVRLDKNGVYKFCKIPSIYMEKWACRIFNKVKSVRVERLQDISEADAIAEGAVHGRYHGLGQIGGSVREGYFELWERINGPGTVLENPWVWVIEFEQIERPNNFLL
jgi:hypothetical protein